MKLVQRFFLSVLMLGIFAASHAQKTTEIIFHKSHEVKKQNAPFSDVVQAGNLFFLAGQIGMDHSTRTMVEGGIKGETEQVIKNIEAVLAQHNMKLENVVKCTVILSTMDDFGAFNEVYSKFFTKKPARTTFAASGLARNAKIEIEVVAVR
ncbi:Rid family detoxifying hydrolase [Flagellimonas sp. HMM57]|uniref:Rid family detoxifying hydrolase n=1 Tax=unclassified Flagellimonas TaxID=2644544 RepID=UPI0013D37EA0|nr:MULTISPECIES: Rid family detoxifying hydrolase [unclassified Flagellimonas]UII74999.1 Rid family detoxifying hydrolase [Flagellimonas sp. HMM57]